MSTLRDIARLSKVSVATVSRVINNDQTYSMKPETRERVWRVISEVGYKVPPPHRGAASWQRTKGSNRVGCILSIVKDKYRDPYFMSVLSGIEARLSHYGYFLDFLHSQIELKNEMTLQEILDRPPAGLILMDALQEDLYQRLSAVIPVRVGVDTRHADIDNVGYDHIQTAMNAVEYLPSRGHRRIAYVGGSPGDTLEISGRFVGYRTALQRAGLPLQPQWIHNCHWDELECIRQVTEMMALEPRPTALFAGSDLMAIAAMSALYSKSISIPDQVAVVGISNIELSRFSSPPLTTYEIPTFEMGRLSVDLLHNRMNDDFPLPRRILLPTRQVLRASA